MHTCGGVRSMSVGCSWRIPRSCHRCWTELIHSNLRIGCCWIGSVQSHRPETQQRRQVVKSSFLLLQPGLPHLTGGRVSTGVRVRVGLWSSGYNPLVDSSPAKLLLLCMSYPKTTQKLLKDLFGSLKYFLTLSVFKMFFPRLLRIKQEHEINQK